MGLKKLKLLQEMRDPALKTQRLFKESIEAEAVNRMEFYKGEKGDPGQTPIKGKDYFTEEDKKLFLEYLRSKIFVEDIQKLIRDGKDGRDGRDGVSVHGRDGKDGLSIKGPPGPPGETPVKGVHYMTKDDIRAIAQVAAEYVKHPPIDVLGAAKTHLEEFKKSLPTTDSILVSILKDPRLRMLLHGGGGSSTTSGSGFTILTATEIPNSVLKIFTFPSATTQPSFIISDNAQMRATTQSGGINWTWNNTLKQATMIIPPQDDIVAIV